jgi:gliding motility-associated-like protein
VNPPGLFINTVTGAIDPSQSAAGVYTVVYNLASAGVCTSQLPTATVEIIQTPQIPEMGDQLSCDSYTLPALTDPGFGYFTQPNGVGAITDMVIDQTTTVYVYATNGVCSDQESFIVTILDTPDVPEMEDVVRCGGYVLPALTVGGYFSSPNGVGPLSGTLNTLGTQTVYVYGTNGNCPAQTEFTVTITDNLEITPINDVSVCTGSYTLPALTVGGYFNSPGGVNPITDLVLEQSQKVYVYYASGTCVDQEEFDVTVGLTPSFTLAGSCRGDDYVIEVVYTDPSFDGSSVIYAWSASDGGIIEGLDTGSSITVTQAGTFTATVTSGDCSNTDDFSIDNVGCVIQKGISANGDGVNDFFDLSGQNVDKLQIFNRYGAIVYNKRNYSNEWGGQSDKGDELPDGTYYFVIERAGGETKTGWIYINRERN